MDIRSDRYSDIFVVLSVPPPPRGNPIYIIGYSDNLCSDSTIGNGYSDTCTVYPKIFIEIQVYNINPNFIKSECWLYALFRRIYTYMIIFPLNFMILILISVD